MLISVYNRVPELYAYCRSAYSQSSCLYFGPYIVLSEEGDKVIRLVTAILQHDTASAVVFGS